MAREWSILAGENDYTTDTFQHITGRLPRPVAEFLHEYRAEVRLMHPSASRVSWWVDSLQSPC